MECARLTRYGLLAVTGADARDFLHAQLTNDIQQLGADRAALAGWCTAKGRLLATMLVFGSGDQFFLQLAPAIALVVATRFSMFILWSKVKIADESEACAQYGCWETRTSLAWDGGVATVPVDGNRTLRLGKGLSLPETKSELDWTLAEIRAGRPWISAATQDKFVPQMVNLEKLGGVSFQKGCYPGQEIVARAQHLGEVKRRMVRVQAPAGTELKAGQDFNGGVVVDSAGGEALAVMPV